MLYCGCYHVSFSVAKAKETFKFKTKFDSVSHAQNMNYITSIHNPLIWLLSPQSVMEVMSELGKNVSLLCY